MDNFKPKYSNDLNEGIERMRRMIEASEATRLERERLNNIIKAHLNPVRK